MEQVIGSTRAAGLPDGRRRARWLLGVSAAGLVGLAAFAFLGARYSPQLLPESFRFLFDKAGWDIPSSFLPYSTNDPYWWVFLVGLTNTLGTGAICIVTATLLGFVVGTVRLSGNLLMADLARAYVDFVRNIPLILQASFWYAVVLHLPPIREAYQFVGAFFLSNRGLFVPKFADAGAVIIVLAGAAIAVWHIVRAFRRWRSTDHEGGRSGSVRDLLIATVGVGAAVWVGMAHPDAFSVDVPVRAGLNYRGGYRLAPEVVALLVAITIYRGAFIAEVFRGGLQSVPKGQIDAAQSLGLPPWLTLFKIRLPLALISMMPALSSEFIIIVKVTSIGIVVGFWDLFAVSSNSAMMTGQTLPVLVVMILIYIALNYAIVAIMNVLNDRVRLPNHGR